MTSAKDGLIVALDVPLKRAETLIEDLSPLVWGFKIGSSLITSGTAWQAALYCAQHSKPIMWDGKWFDPARIVTMAAESMAALGVNMLTVCLASGRMSVQAAVANSRRDTLVLGVTALTSQDDQSCLEIYDALRVDTIKRLADIGYHAKVGGFVCSPQDLAILAPIYKSVGKKFVVTAVRPEGANPMGQASFGTPTQSLEGGADFMVVGDPITNPPESIGSPTEAVRRIDHEIVSYTKRS
ncbi:MAG TPA: orotidine 5'-phosphate decarboxylase / HUMPS family protein [Candidatus Paceibacterota bacterium]